VLAPTRKVVDPTARNNLTHALGRSGERPIRTYFVLLSFRDVPPERRRFFNVIPTSFALGDEQVDALIAAGSELLHGNAEFRRFLADVDR